MGGHGGLNILPEKRWHVYNKDNRLKVALDEAKQREREAVAAEQEQRAKQEFRYRILTERAAQRHSQVIPRGEVDGFQVRASLEVPYNQSIRRDVEDHELREAHVQQYTRRRHINFFEQEELLQQNQERLAEEHAAKRRRGPRTEQHTSDAKFDEKFQFAYGLRDSVPWYAAHQRALPTAGDVSYLAASEPATEYPAHVEQAWVHHFVPTPRKQHSELGATVRQPYAVHGGEYHLPSLPRAASHGATHSRRGQLPHSTAHMAAHMSPHSMAGYAVNARAQRDVATSAPAHHFIERGVPLQAPSDVVSTGNSPVWATVAGSPSYREDRCGRLSSKGKDRQKERRKHKDRGKRQDIEKEHDKAGLEGGDKKRWHGDELILRGLMESVDKLAAERVERERREKERERQLLRRQGTGKVSQDAQHSFYARWEGEGRRGK